MNAAPDRDPLAGYQADSRHSRFSSILLRMVPVALFSLGLGTMTTPAFAHYPWIIVTESDAAPAFRIHFGHRFPGDGRLAPHQLDEVRIIEPDGRSRTLVLDDQELHPLAPLGAGTHLLAIAQRPAFWSRTIEGGRRASREQYPDAFSCSQSVNTMKAVFGDGTGDSWRREQGHPLELLPLVNPSTLLTGDALAVRVTFHGEPWTGEVKATYAGFEQQGEESYAVSVPTDSDGVARFVPASEGHWLVRAFASEDYPDPQVCDRRSYTSTLTFFVD